MKKRTALKVMKRLGLVHHTYTLQEFSRMKNTMCPRRTWREYCQHIVNADRNAGLNIAVRAGTSSYLPVFGTQIPDGHGLVNGHLWQDEEGDTRTSQVYIPPDCKPTASAEGN